MLLFHVIAGFAEALASPAKQNRHARQGYSRKSCTLVLRSTSALVMDQKTGKYLVQKQADFVQPIASITKLMTAMVVLDAKMDIDEYLTITEEDVDTIRHSRSRLPVNTSLTRGNALLLALMASENRAAHALGRAYPGGLIAFVAAMNAKAKSLELRETSFADPTGLSDGNRSSARDLVRMVNAARRYQLIRKYTTVPEASFLAGGRTEQYRNSNPLIRNLHWQIGLSKTGFIQESGRCLVMQSKIANRHLLIVLLGAQGELTCYGDANRIKQWLEGSRKVRYKTRKK